MHTFPPAALAVVTDPASVNCHPALLQSAWGTLKRARGQTVNFAALGVTGHLIAAPQSDTVAMLDAACRRTSAQVRAIMAQGTTGGDAA